MAEFKSYKLFKNYFGVYDGEGQAISGFFEQLDYSGHEELELLEDIIPLAIDVYLYNNYQRRYVNSLWSRYLNYDETAKHWVIDTAFYTDFAAALYPALLSSENFYELTKLDWNEIKEVVTRLKEYGEQHTKTEHGDDVRTADQYEDSTDYDYKTHTDTLTDKLAQYKVEQDNTYGITQETQTNTTSAFNSADYEPDNKSVVDTTQHTDDLDTTYGEHDDVHETVYGAHKDTTTFNSAEKVITNAHGDIDVTADEYKDRENVTTKKEYDKAKLLEIKARLAELNVYKLIGDAVAATMLRSDYDDCMSHAGYFFPVD